MGYELPLRPLMPHEITPKVRAEWASEYRTTNIVIVMMLVLSVITSVLFGHTMVKVITKMSERANISVNIK